MEQMPSFSYRFGKHVGKEKASRTGIVLEKTGFPA